MDKLDVRGRLVRICNDTTRVGVAQLPVTVEDMRPMVAEFSDACEGCSSQPVAGQPGGSTFRQFCSKLDELGPRETERALSVGLDQYVTQLGQMVPCVGCRRSVEKLYVDMATGQYQTLLPMGVTESLRTVVKDHFARDKATLYKLLVVSGSRARAVLDGATKCRRNKRCVLHSLDSHYAKPKVTWQELWALMSKECQDECCIVESDTLSEMLETYLQKHRFCTECKCKVTRAYELAVGDPVTEADKGYRPALFADIRTCHADGHIHVKACPDFIQGLIDRAEPELFGSTRERHAKTLDIAQGEVLICLGLYMFDRLHRLVGALRQLHQTYTLLYSTAVICLHNNLQAAYEAKFGLGESVEMLCAELQTATATGESARKKKNKRKGAKTAPVKVFVEREKGSSEECLSSKCPEGRPVVGKHKQRIGSRSESPKGTRRNDTPAEDRTDSPQDYASDQGYASLELSPTSRKVAERSAEAALIERSRSARKASTDECSEDSLISADELRAFERKMERVDRVALRQRLEDNFEQMRARLAAKLPAVA